MCKRTDLILKYNKQVNTVRSSKTIQIYCVPDINPLEDFLKKMYFLDRKNLDKKWKSFRSFRNFLLISNVCPKKTK